MRTTARCLMLACVTGGLVAAVGCHREPERTTGDTTSTTKTEERYREPTGTTTITGASIANATAIDRVVAARCEREATCKNVGSDKKYSSAQACSDKIRSDMKDDLNAKDCPRGVDKKELNDCLAAIHKEECHNPLDVIGRLNDCRTGKLCKSEK